MDKILIGAPVRNRAWILPEYLQAIHNLDYPKDKISLCFILNDSVDESEEILIRWAEVNRNKYRSIEILEENFENPEDYGEYRRNLPSIANNRRFKIIPTLAKLRDRLLDKCVYSGNDYLFSIDSDIIINPDILNNLLAQNKEIIAATVANSYTSKGKISAYNFAREGEYRTLPGDKKLFEVIWTGAIILIIKKVCENKKIRYSSGDFTRGEDISFCNSALENKIPIWILHDMQRHIMNREELKNF